MQVEKWWLLIKTVQAECTEHVYKNNNKVTTITDLLMAHNKKTINIYQGQYKTMKHVSM